eukprot:364261-Chlamydomonas_euryale.AAC.1
MRGAPRRMASCRLQGGARESFLCQRHARDARAPYTCIAHKYKYCVKAGSSASAHDSKLHTLPCNIQEHTHDQAA